MRPIRLAVLVVPALLAALLLAPSTRAQPLVAFDPPTYLSAGNSPVSVATGDFNGDDDPDLESPTGSPATHRDEHAVVAWRASTGVYHWR
jgi:hypothetical protein